MVGRDATEMCGAAGRGDELVSVVGGQVVDLGGRLEADGQTARLCVRSLASGDGGMPSVWPAADVVMSCGADAGGSSPLRSENKRQPLVQYQEEEAPSYLVPVWHNQKAYAVSSP